MGEEPEQLAQPDLCAACRLAVPTGSRFCARCAVEASFVTPALDVEVLPAETSSAMRSSDSWRREPEAIDPELLSPGTQLGVYRIIERIGSGGIGHVYLAEHTKLGRHVAIKKLRARFASDPAMVERFFAEARAANRIAHENIVQITDFIEDDRGGSYLIMEMLEGTGLDVELVDGRLPLARSLHILVQTASALSAAHRAGIIHRDLKPANLFLVRRGDDPDFVKLLDFGTAKLVGDAGAGAALATGAGSVVGTPAYMSPEQAKGHAVDVRADVYTLGVMMFELVTGRLPFDGQTLGELIIQHSTIAPPRLSRAPGAPSELPLGLEDLTMRCLRKVPNERPSMAEVETELVRVARALGHRPDPQVRPRTRWPLAVPLVLAVAAVGVGAWMWHSAGVPTDGPGPIVPPPPTASAPETIASPAVVPVAALGPEPPATPSTITIRFTSEPVGAEVRPEGAAEPIGVTPFSVRLERQVAGAARFELRAPGHTSVRCEVGLEEDATIHVVLPRAAHRPAHVPTHIPTRLPGRL